MGVHVRVREKSGVLASSTSVGLPASHNATRTQIVELASGVQEDHGCQEQAVSVIALAGSVRLTAVSGAEKAEEGAESVSQVLFVGNGLVRVRAGAALTVIATGGPACYAVVPGE